MEALAVLIAAVCHALTMLVLYAALGILAITAAAGLIIFLVDALAGDA